MPRYARLHAPGSVVHVIARFVNRQFRLRDDDERAFYLTQLGRALERTDWRCLAYALMSNHAHLTLLSGQEPPWVLLKSLHGAVARHLNRTQGAFGPVFAERATTIVMPSDRTGAVVAYQHNNPVRAGLVPDAAACGWTSHRAWTGLEPAPRWLDVTLGLHLAGFDASPTGRAAFDRFVLERRGEPRDRATYEARLAAMRRAARSMVAIPVELSAPTMDELGIVSCVLGPASAPLPRWPGELGRLLAEVESRLAVPIDDMRSRRRTAPIVRARRLAALVAVRLLRRDALEIASELAISRSAVTGLLGASKKVAALADLARDIAAGLRAT